MHVSRLSRTLGGALLGAALATGAMTAPAQAAPPAPSASSGERSQAAPAAVRVIRYDASRAAEFRTVVDQGAQIWNQHVRNVRFVAGTPADVVVYADNGWPRAQPAGLGRGRVWMGRQATAQGHYALRIASHELGHILGLPDRRTGLCSDLMSGASAGTSCRNPNPNAAEIAEVERNFQFGVSGVTPGVTITERVPASAR
ncbi:snapalysin family zinc-dependent metalloprotease [Actinomadura kijaniata]|uniref:snapalysin family zinc-dependent metalloprotease n=1 Tax=Actinomadura kijaniata TaxID=46161 RepID=UPI000837712A|nr:snapalysin family zinc-dependent metalloprotease [Actinomadura kijaniata]